MKSRLGGRLRSSKARSGPFWASIRKGLTDDHFRAPEANVIKASQETQMTIMSSASTEGQTE